MELIDFKNIVSFFFPSQRKAIRNIYKKSYEKEITRYSKNINKQIMTT